MSARPCGGCLQAKSESSFSWNQMTKPTPRCTECIEAKVVVSPQASGLLAAAGFRQCSGSHKKFTNKFSSPQATRCIECDMKRAGEEAEEENIRKRTKKDGACQVKDVSRVYGHVCEIPIMAYREAGVARTRTDWVTEQDVDKASNAWDARSVAHDIDTQDTQWGMEPGGGAYKDSENYFGPGMYDYY